MRKTPWLYRVELVVLSITLGMMMLALRRLILVSDLFGIDTMHAAAHQAALRALVTTWPWDLLTFTICASSALLAYRLLIQPRRTDAPWYWIAGIGWLVLGGIMGSLYTMTNGGSIGLQAYALHGVLGAGMTIALLIVGYGIVAGGRRIDTWLRHQQTEEG